MTSTAIQVPQKPKIPDILRRLPQRTRTLLARIQVEAEVSLTTCAFIALRAAGLTQGAAYHAIRPHVTESSAPSLGNRLDRAVRHLAVRVPSDAAQEMLADWRVLALTLHEDPHVALKAIDIGNRVLRRYADEGVTVNVLGDVKLSEPSEPPQGADGMVLDA